MELVICGDALEKLKELPAGIVQTCVTSPPYYGLRDYGHAGQIGLESTPDEFIARLVAVFREVKRVLKDDGTLWVNIGDSYAGSGKGEGDQAGAKQRTNRSWDHGFTDGRANRDKRGRVGLLDDCKPKDLIGIPWMLAFALRADGWYLRSDIIWHKPNPMPESVTDRPTKSHEHIFLLSKSPQYYYDADAIKEQSVESLCGKGLRPSRKRGEFNGKTNSMPGLEAFRATSETRNKRDVWTVTTKPFKGSHFATFPKDLITPCILAGSKPGDVVLDPFGGAGTTALVSKELGRGYVTVELNQKYVDEIIHPRILSVNAPLIPGGCNV